MHWRWPLGEVVVKINSQAYSVCRPAALAEWKSLLA